MCERNPKRMDAITCPQCGCRLVVRRAPKERVSYADVDWSKPNRAIASELQLDEMYVNKLRRKHAPESIGKYQALRDAADWRSADWRLGNTALARLRGVGISAVAMARKKYAPGTMRQKKRS